MRRVIDAQESERRRLALELHDETGQALTSILLGLKAIRSAPTPELAEEAEAGVRELVVQALQDVRALAVELRPAALDDFGLGPALERLGHTFGEQSGIETTVEVSLASRLPPELETTLYRIVQEALTNVVKHAGADRVSIVVTLRAGQDPWRRSTTTARDSPRTASATARSDSIGMQERLALVGGTLGVRVKPWQRYDRVRESPGPSGGLRPGPHRSRRSTRAATRRRRGSPHGRRRRPP